MRGHEMLQCYRDDLEELLRGIKSVLGWSVGHRPSFVGTGDMEPGSLYFSQTHVFMVIPERRCTYG